MVYNTAKCKNAYDVERAVHDGLRGCRQVGEWFDVGEAAVVTLLEKQVLDFGSGVPFVQFNASYAA